VVMKEIIGEVFGMVLELLIEQGHVRLEDYFVDGSKMRANARRHSAVWAKNTERYKQQVQESIGALLDEIEEVNRAEQEPMEIMTCQKWVKKPKSIASD